MSYLNYLSKLRNGVVRKNENNELELLLSNFRGTEQQKDIEARTPLVGDFFRTKVNVKSFDDDIMKQKGLPPLDFSCNEKVFNAMKEEFDIPYWAFVALDKKAPLKDYNNAFTYQLKACNLHCPWCYVDDRNKDAKEDAGAKFFSIPEKIDAFEEKRKAMSLYILRSSGGEPTLAVEQWLESLRELERRNLHNGVYVWCDTNLTTGHFLDMLEEGGEIEKNLLEKIGEHKNIGLLCSFKGTDRESFCAASGVRMPELHEEQFYTLKKLTKAGIDTYPFIYDSNPETLEAFMGRGAREFGDNFYLKTWVVKLKLYGPERERLGKKGIIFEEYQKQLDENFAKSKGIMQNLIMKKFGRNYQEDMRPQFKLKAK